jgi:copper resistance protein C
LRRARWTKYYTFRFWIGAVSQREREGKALKNIMRVALALPALWALHSGAWAHAHLEKATPAPDSKTTQVREIRLDFSEAVEAKLSVIKLETGEERTVVEPEARPDPKDGKALVVSLYEPLAPGIYRVVWSVVTADGHKVKGSYSFLVSR